MLNHSSIDSSINHTFASERVCAASYLDHALPNDLSILQRGYNAFWLYTLYIAKKLFFCVRAKINISVLFKQFAESGKALAVITLEPNNHTAEQCIEKGLSTCSLTLRLIRVDLDGELEVLITNLMDEQAMPAREFKELYHLRWGVINKNYKCLKQWVEIENFSGKSVLSVQ